MVNLDHIFELVSNPTPKNLTEVSSLMLGQKKTEDSLAVMDFLAKNGSKEALEVIYDAVNSSEEYHLNAQFLAHGLSLLLQKENRTPHDFAADYFEQGTFENNLLDRIYFLSKLSKHGGDDETARQNLRDLSPAIVNCVVKTHEYLVANDLEDILDALSAYEGNNVLNVGIVDDITQKIEEQKNQRHLARGQKRKSEMPQDPDFEI